MGFNYRAGRVTKEFEQVTETAEHTIRHHATRTSLFAPLHGLGMNILCASISLSIKQGHAGR